jgi:hypothetical protein
MEKTCSKCKNIKDINDFAKDKCNKTGYGPYCKPCKREKVKTQYHKDPSKQISRVNKWFKENPDKSKQYGKNLSRKEYYAAWRKKNPYKQFMSEEERKLMRTYRDKVKRGIQTDRNKTWDLLGCSFLELKDYIGSQFYPEMSWDNWGGVWELDHIKGCVNFDLKDPIQLAECFHYTNLRPLFKTTKIALSFGYDIIGNRNRPKRH